MKQSNELVSIIIPHHNNFKILHNCVTSLYQSTYENIEIIIVDNASTDSSIQNIKEQFSKLLIINSKKNLGYAGGCNLGAKTAKGELLFFLNNDTVICKDTIELLVEKITSNNSIASVQPKIKSLINKDCFDYAGAAGGFIDFLVFPFTRGRIFSTIEKDDNQYNDSVKIFWASGAGFITRKSIFNKMDGFDKNLFSHMEEIDYHWKSYLAGHEVWVEPKAELFHLGGSTLSMQSAKKSYYNHRNSLVLLLTNYPLWTSIFYFILRLPFEFISSLKDLLTLRPLHFLYHYMAIFWIIFNINILIDRRKKIRKIKTIDYQSLIDDGLILNSSIVLKYYIFNKKKYSKF